MVKVPLQCRYVLQSTWSVRHVCMQQRYRPGMPCLLDKLTWCCFFVVHNMSVHFVSYTVAWDFMFSHILMMVTSPCSAYALAQARPTMSYIPLVYLNSQVSTKVYLKHSLLTDKHIHDWLLTSTCQDQSSRIIWSCTLLNVITLLVGEKLCCVM